MHSKKEKMPPKKRSKFCFKPRLAEFPNHFFFRYLIIFFFFVLNSFIFLSISCKSILFLRHLLKKKNSKENKNENCFFVWIIK